jgi:hypothetical protein
MELKMGNFVDLTGQTFGKLLVLKKHAQKQGKEILWECECKCGNKKISTRTCLIKKITISCGCHRHVSDLDYLKQLEKRLLKFSVFKGECREWIGKKSFGYGMTTIRGKNIFSHRAAYLVWKGEIKEGLFVCHTCDNRSCINPNHLFVGTSKDNVNDMMNKNRHNFGGYFR